MKCWLSTVGDRQVAKEVMDVFRPVDSWRWSATRQYTGPLMDLSAVAADGTTALQLVRKQQTAWEKLQDKVGLPAYPPG
jgi:hypothetical protein